MSHISYVKLRGTCTKCKKAKKDFLIPKGELFWERDTGQFMIKFHFDCYAPQGRKWPFEKLTDEFLEEVHRLKKKDQKRVLEVFEGTEDQVAALGDLEEAEEEDDEEEEKKQTKKRVRPVEEIEADGKESGWTTLKNDELKEVLRAHKKPVSGAKTSLVERCELIFQKDE